MKRIIIITLLLSLVVCWVLVKGSETVRDVLQRQQSHKLELLDNLK